MKNFGCSPSDWYEGANEGHAFEVRFAAPPDAKMKLTIAKIFEKALRKGAAETGNKPWLWSGEWALLLVGQRWNKKRGEPEGAKDAIDAVVYAFYDVDKKHKVDQVVFLGITAHGRSRDDGAPTPGPDWPGFSCDADELLGTGPRFKPATKPASDAAFEAERAKNR